MWQHYKKTFVGMQVTIAVVTMVVYLMFGHLWMRAAAFFVVMQVSAVIGAVWAVRINALVERRDSRLPLRAKG